MAGLNIHRNDIVEVLTGNDAGKKPKRGRVLRVFPDKNSILVEHVRVVKKTVSSKSGKNTKGGIAEQESPIHISNVAIVCPSCSNAVRVGYKVEGDTKTRVCRKCGAALPTKSK
jgi:large subunit ribosomal protein L24